MRFQRVNVGSNPTEVTFVILNTIWFGCVAALCAPRLTFLQLIFCFGQLSAEPRLGLICFSAPGIGEFALVGLYRAARSFRSRPLGIAAVFSLINKEIYLFFRRIRFNFLCRMLEPIFFKKQFYKLNWSELTTLKIYRNSSI